MMYRMFLFSTLTLLAALAGLGACSLGGGSGPVAAPGSAPAATPQASCGPGSLPETGIQGRVSQADHDSGRAAQGFTCNTELVGSYSIPNAMGTVGGFKVERYKDAAGHDCAYYDTTLLYPTNAFDAESGVNVLDMSDPAHPVLTAQLLTPAMQSPHESLVVNQARGLLVAVTGNPAFLPGVVDIYDISQDCRSPVLKSTSPVGVIGHESGMAPDGNTFYSASPSTHTLVAVDITNPSLPSPLGFTDIGSHGLSISADGNRAYVAVGGGFCNFGNAGGYGQECAAYGSSLPGVPAGGLTILDVSEIQARKPNPTMKVISSLVWDTVSIPQNAIPITINGHPYIVEIDEFGAQQQVGAGRIIDIGDETKPKVISNLRLEVHQPENFAAQANDPGTTNPIQGYAGHYCNVPKRTDPGIVACSMILSGLRVFDIRDPFHPREVAYFNPPPNPGSFPDSGNYAMSSPSFVPERKEIWYTDGNSGFYAVRVTNGMWP